VADSAAIDGPSVSTGPVRLLDVRVLSSGNSAEAALLRDDPLQVVLDIEVSEEQLGLDLAVYITNARGVRVLDEVLSDGLVERFPVGKHQVTLDLPPVLNVGPHVVGVWIGTASRDLLNEPAAASFELLGSNQKRPERAVVLNLPFKRTR
jgi:hypothetical protein